jgi:hypothetical protein
MVFGFKVFVILVCNGWIMVDGKLCIKRTLCLNVHIWWEYTRPKDFIMVFDFSSCKHG